MSNRRCLGVGAIQLDGMTTTDSVPSTATATDGHRLLGRRREVERVPSPLDCSLLGLLIPSFKEEEEEDDDDDERKYDESADACGDKTGHDTVVTASFAEDREAVDGATTTLTQLPIHTIATSQACRMIVNRLREFNICQRRHSAYDHQHCQHQNNGNKNSSNRIINGNGNSNSNCIRMTTTDTETAMNASSSSSTTRFLQSHIYSQQSTPPPVNHFLSIPEFNVRTPSAPTFPSPLPCEVPYRPSGMSMPSSSLCPSSPLSHLLFPSFTSSSSFSPLDLNNSNNNGQRRGIADTTDDRNHDDDDDELEQRIVVVNCNQLTYK
jgi:hypothetical protein